MPYTLIIVFPLLLTHLIVWAVAAVYIKETNTILGVVYRAPTSPVNDLFDELSHFIEQCEIDKVCPDIYLMGDFNMPDIDWETHTGGTDSSAQTLLKFANTFFLTQLVDSPTRGSNILDLVLTNRPDYVIDTEVTESFI